MAIFTGPRIRADNVFGTVTDNPLSAVATTLNSAGLANLPAVASAHALIVLDPLRTAGAPEIIIVTAHTGAATSATVTRGALGTSARSHAAGVAWVHAVDITDAIIICTAATRPADQYEGQLVYETDTDTYSGHDGAGWQTLAKLTAWTTYVPTNTNITLGNGTLVARYTRVGRTVHMMWDLLFGTTTAFAGAILIGIPAQAAATGIYSCSGSILDNGTQNYNVGGRITAGSNFIRPETNGGGGIDSTTPFTWTNLDRLSFTATYEAAA